MNARWWPRSRLARFRLICYARALAGRVVDAATGEPIANAELVLRATDPIQSRLARPNDQPRDRPERESSDAQGEFR